MSPFRMLKPDQGTPHPLYTHTHGSLSFTRQVAELHRQLAPHMLRRLKKDVLKQLPPKMEQMVRMMMV